MPLDPQKLIPVGHVGKPHGLAGGFFLQVPPSSTWGGYTHVYLLEKNRAPKLLEVRRTYLSGGRPVVCLEALVSRNAIEALQGALLAVDRSQLGPTHPGEWLVHDLVGCVVWVSPTERVGVVQSVTGFGAQDCLEILLDKGGETALYPFIDPFVKHVDVDAKSILVEPEPVFLGGGELT